MEHQQGSKEEEEEQGERGGKHQKNIWDQNWKQIRRKKKKKEEEEKTKNRNIFGN